LSLIFRKAHPKKSKTRAVSQPNASKKITDRVLEHLPTYFLDSTSDTDKILAASKVLRIVLAGEFCQHASAVFGYGDGEFFLPRFVELT